MKKRETDFNDYMEKQDYKIVANLIFHKIMFTLQAKHPPFETKINKP